MRCKKTGKAPVEFGPLPCFLLCADRVLYPDKAAHLSFTNSLHIEGIVTGRQTGEIVRSAIRIGLAAVVPVVVPDIPHPVLCAAVSCNPGTGKGIAGFSGLLQVGGAGAIGGNFWARSAEIGAG